MAVDSRSDEVRKASKTLGGHYFCVDFSSSSELIGYVDLTDSYEIWPKCSFIINAQKCVRLFFKFQIFSLYALSIYEDQQIFNLPT